MQYDVLPSEVKCDISRGHSERNTLGFGTFCGFPELLVGCAKLSFRGGYVCVCVCVCVLFEICEKMPFQKCMGFGGGWLGGHSSEHRAEAF